MEAAKTAMCWASFPAALKSQGPIRLDRRRPPKAPGATPRSDELPGVFQPSLFTTFIQRLASHSLSRLTKRYPSSGRIHDCMCAREPPGDLEPGGFSAPARRSSSRWVMVTVVHEVAHFFGIDDPTLHRLGWG